MSAAFRRRLQTRHPRRRDIDSSYGRAGLSQMLSAQSVDVRWEGWVFGSTRGDRWIIALNSIESDQWPDNTRTAGAGNYNRNGLDFSRIPGWSCKRRRAGRKRPTAGIRSSPRMLILVTGAGGFIGSHVCEELLRRGHQVRALVRYTSHGSRGHLSDVGDDEHRLNVVYGDVRDSYQMEQFVQGCDIVLHLAALIGIPYSYVAPESYVATNVNGTLNILQACRKAGTRRVVVTSTSEVYGTAQSVPMSEAHPLQAQSPYAASKIAADSLAQSFARSFDLPVVVLRPFNTYGPRQSARAIIPTILTQALSGAESIELGELSPRRDFTYVADTARAFALAAEAADIEGETIHFGQGAAVSVGEIAERCVALVGRRIEIKTVDERRRPERSEVGLLLCDATKAHERLGWKPEVSLDEGLKRTAEYIQQQLANYRPAEYSL